MGVERFCGAFVGSGFQPAAGLLPGVFGFDET
jgi:hypothetical protein